jgi:hypothetical protein
MKFKSTITAISLAACLALAGCATSSDPSVPTSYVNSTGQTVNFTASEETTLQYCATVKANLATIQTGAALATGGWLTLAIKQPSTEQQDGTIAWQISSAIYSITNGTMPPPSVFSSTVGDFTKNATDTTVVQDVGSLSSILSGTYTSYYNQLQKYLATTNNTYVQQQLVATGVEVLNAIAAGVQAATEQYAPATPAPTTTTTSTFNLFLWSDLEYI